MRRFAIVGRRARGAPDFLLEDVPGTAGRLDVLLRAMRAALLVSHGLRHDVIVYLALLGGDPARTLRVRGADVRFLRPDERSLAILVQKCLRLGAGATESAFQEVKPGIAIATGGVDAILADAPEASPFVLDDGGVDVRGADLGAGEDRLFFLGDHLGLAPDVVLRLAAIGAPTLSVGPVRVQADDAVAILSNELDRRTWPRSGPGRG